VADADPEIIFGVAFAGITCLQSMYTVEFAATDDPDCIATESISRLKVADDVAVFVTAILVTTVVVDVFGTVYSVVLLVAAAVLARALLVVAISYYLS
jgi:hypothetical protein